MKIKLNLPTPDTEALERSYKLQQKLIRTIKQRGPIPFSDYMQRVLYTPELGYYTNPCIRLGAQGDFVTAAEVSPLFGQSIARQINQILAHIDTHACILEFGAGSGKLATDILLTLNQEGILPDKYQILEISAHLRAQQQTYLKAQLPAELFERIEWLDALPQPGWCGVVLADEVLDAMPVERFFLTPSESWRMAVDWDGEQFIWAELPITDTFLQKVVDGLRQLIHPTQLGYKAEVNLNIAPWLKSLSDFVAQGVALLIDYGFPQKELYQKERLNGSLRCFYQQSVHDNPLIYPGLQDITTHVDFTEVAEAGFDAGFKVAGFTTQAHFLMSTGLLEHIPTDLPVTEQLKLAQQIKTLTLPDEMGEIFKVIALSKHLDISLLGFQLTDLRETL